MRESRPSSGNSRPLSDSEVGISPVMGGLEAVLFDMDGTLIRSDFDWPAIREELGVEGPSLIDALNGLPEPRRSESRRRLEEIERAVCRRAEVIDGAGELLESLAEHGVRTALVTNNSSENTGVLIGRFGLVFDLVLTRDCGLYKPSGAPLIEAMRRLEVRPDATVAVGDSRYDILAAREAGCGEVILVGEGIERWGGDADRVFPGLRQLGRYLLSLVR